MAGPVAEVLARTDIGREAAAALRDSGASVRFEDLGERPGATDSFNGRTMDVVVDTHDRSQLEQASAVVRAAALADAVRSGQVEVQPARIRETDRVAYVESQRRAEAAALGRQGEFHRELATEGYDLPRTPLGETVETVLAREAESAYLSAYDDAVRAARQQDPGVQPHELRQIGREAGVAELMSRELFDGNHDSHGREWDASQHPKAPAGMHEHIPASTDSARQQDRLVREHAAAQRELSRIEADWDRVLHRPQEGFPGSRSRWSGETGRRCSTCCRHEPGTPNSSTGSIWGCWSI